MFGIGAQEMIVILVVALLVFGPKRLPELARTVGRGLAEFRRASTDMRQAFNLEEAAHKIERPPQPAQAGIDRPSESEEASDDASATEEVAAQDVPPLTDFERHENGEEPLAPVPTDPRASTTASDKKPPEPSGGG